MPTVWYGDPMHMKRIAAGHYETTTHTIKGIATTCNGRQGAHINRWIVTDKATNKIIAIHPTLSRVKEALQ